MRVSLMRLESQNASIYIDGIRSLRKIVLYSYNVGNNEEQLFLVYVLHTALSKAYSPSPLPWRNRNNAEVK